MKFTKIIYKLFFLFLFFLSTHGYSEIIKKIEISGNERISEETIKLFISTDINDEINDTKLNNILKELYETNFFKDISVKFYNQNNNKATYFDRRTPKMSEIKLNDLSKLTSTQLYNKIRALGDPYPNAFLRTKDGKRLLIKKVVIK